MRVTGKILSMLAVLVVVLSLLAVTALADTATVDVTVGSAISTVHASDSLDAQPDTNVASTFESILLSYTAAGSTATLSGGSLDAPIAVDTTGATPSTVQLDYGANNFTLTVSTTAASPTDPAVVKSYYFRVVRALLPAANAGFTFNAYTPAEDVPEEGSEGNPYRINTVADLRQLSANVNGGTSYSGKFFVLGDDLNEVGKWIPIGTAAHPFSGSFDFMGRPISGYEIDRDIISGNGLTDIGLFGYLSGAEIKNTEATTTVSGSIEYESADATHRYIGLLAGRAVNSSISDLSTGGSISVDAGTVGAFSIGRLVGALDANSSASGCGSAASLIFANAAANPAVSNIGGLAGENAGEIANCDFTVAADRIDASLALGKVHFGGVAGVNSGIISGSTVTLTGEMKGSHYHSGGIAGTNSGHITDCALSGSGAFTAVPHRFGAGDEGSWGGIAGTNLSGGTISDSDNSNTALTSFSAPGAEVNIGGIAGANYGTVSGCSSKADLAVINASSVYLGGVAGGSSGPISDCYFSGAIDADLAAPLGTQSAAGGIVGISSSSLDGCTSSGSVKLSARHSGAGSASLYVGGVSGAYSGSSVMEDCFSSGNVTARAYLDGEDNSVLKLYTGGLTGYNKATIRNCGSSGDVTTSIEEISGSVKAKCASYSGGAAGFNTGKIQNVYSTGKVAANALNPASSVYAGGVTGSSSGALENVYATGDISADALKTPTLTFNGFKLHDSPPTITVGCVTGEKVKKSTVSMAYYSVEMAPSEEVLGVGGLTSDSGTGCVQFSSEFMATDEFADALTTNAGYLNYKKDRSGKSSIYREWAVGVANDGFPVFGYHAMPLNSRPYVLASDSDESESSSESGSSESSITALEPLPYSEPAVITVSDRNANPGTGISGVNPALGLAALSAMLIPSAGLLWLYKRKK